MKQLWRTRLTVAAFPLAALALSWLIYAGLLEREARVSESWNGLEGALVEQVELAPRLVEIVGQVPVTPAERNGPAREVPDALAALGVLEGQARRYLSDARVLDDQDRMSDLAEAGGELNRAIVAIAAAAKQIPAARESAAYTELAEEVAAADRRFARAKAEFNQAVRTHNGAITGFPMRLFARLADFRTRTYFRGPTVGRR